MNRESDEASGDRSLYAKDVLSRFGFLSWFRCPLEKHPQLGIVQVSHVGWRFAAPCDDLKKVFEEVANAAPRHVEWIFKAQKNWLILPLLLSEETHRNGGDFGAAQSFLVEDQDFCIAVSKDLDLILAALELKGSPSPSRTLPGPGGPESPGQTSVLAGRGAD
ncbi:hypothetical protein [Streptomyces xanthophaeus]